MLLVHGCPVTGLQLKRLLLYTHMIHMSITCMCTLTVNLFPPVLTLLESTTEFFVQKNFSKDFLTSKFVLDMIN